MGIISGVLAFFIGLFINSSLVGSGISIFICSRAYSNPQARFLIAKCIDNDIDEDSFFLNISLGLILLNALKYERYARIVTLVSNLLIVFLSFGLIFVYCEKDIILFTIIGYMLSLVIIIAQHANLGVEAVQAIVSRYEKGDVWGFNYFQLVIPVVIIIALAIPFITGVVDSADAPSPHSSRDYIDDTDTDIAVYVTETGNKYHLHNGSSLYDDGIEMSLESADQLGYTPCKRCDPPVLDEEDTKD